MSYLKLLPETKTPQPIKPSISRTAKTLILFTRAIFNLGLITGFFASILLRVRVSFAIGVFVGFGIAAWIVWHA